MTHTHDFKRYVLTYDYQEFQDWDAHKIFSEDLDGWYTGYQCDCGENGYALPEWQE